MTTTPAWTAAIRRDRLRRGLCPSCGELLTHGYGLAFGPGIGAYEACLNRKCLDPWSHKWADIEMEEHAPGARLMPAAIAST